MATSEELARRVAGPGGRARPPPPSWRSGRGSAPRGGWSTWRAASRRRGPAARPRGTRRCSGAARCRRPRPSTATTVGRVVAGGHGARVAPCAHGRRRHRQDARGVGPLRAGVREGARGASFRGVLARDAPEARPRRREARPGGPRSSAGLACSSSTSSGFSHSTRTGRGCSSGSSPTPARGSRW